MHEKINPETIVIIGAGLAGSEAAFQIARRGIHVKLCEMRPGVATGVHKTGLPAELVCSNSLGTDSPDSAPGLLKYELEKYDSLILRAARENRVPAGQALAVDRLKFSHYIHAELQNFQNIQFINDEIIQIPEKEITIIASGPITSPALAGELSSLLGKENLYFFDAVCPVVTAESIDMSIAFQASRYGKGTADYLNCPMNSEQYNAFYEELIDAQVTEVRDFERNLLFEGCMPVEEIARRGRQTLLFGPLKPVGLDEDATAVVQLRRENRESTMYSLVGFQTRLKWGEQKRVFRMIPGLEKAEFIRYGVMHKNIYIDSPSVLSPALHLTDHPRIFMAGQLTGVEGYAESAAIGLAAGINAYRLTKAKPLLTWPGETAIGSLINYITDRETKSFQPMNTNFGILPGVKIKGSKKDRRKAAVDLGKTAIDDFMKIVNEMPPDLHSELC